jgi:hypothetical protein
MRKAGPLTLTLVCAALCAALQLCCSSDSVLSGGGTDVSNAGVMGRIVTVSGSGVGNAQVRLIPESYLPYMDDSLQGGLAVLTDTTGGDGRYSFPHVKPGIYNVVAVHLTQRTRLLRAGIVVRRRSFFPAPIPDDSLRAPGRVAIILRPGLNYTAGGILFFIGTDIYKRVTTTGGSVFMDSLPAGLVFSVYYSDPAHPAAYSSVSGAVDVQAGTTYAAGTTLCLLVTGKGARLSVADSLIVSRLTSIGVTVSVKPDTAVRVADTSGKHIILISPTATSQALQSLITVSTSLIVCQTKLYPLLNMTGNVKGVDYNAYDKATVNYTDSVHQNTVEMRDVSHPISPNIAGTKVLLTYPQYIVWGAPTLKAKLVASVYGNINLVVIFTYEINDMMVSVMTPGRRVGLSFHEDMFPCLNTLGWTLFDNSVYWALRMR